MASAVLTNSFETAVSLLEESDRFAAVNRRLHERLTAADLRWLRGARLKYGPELRVLDVSAGGMRIETDSPLAPNASIIVELSGPDSPILVPSRVLRCRVARLGEVVKYEGACAFNRPLAIPGVNRSSEIEAPVSGASPMAGENSTTASWQKVVARYRDGRLRSGYTNDFHPSKAHLHLSPDPRLPESVFIPVSQLKALYFVRAFVGDPTYVEQKVFSHEPHGRKVEITFQDDEVLVGSTLAFQHDGQGFFVYPADPRSNNLRVFVTAAGMREMSFL